MKKFKIASKQLRILNDYYQGKMPLSMLLMNSYTSLMLNNTKQINRFSSSACRKFDGINCWIKTQSLYWENFGKVIETDEKLVRDETFTIDKLKQKVKIERLIESSNVDQKDIEEMDGAEVILLKVNEAY